MRIQKIYFVLFILTGFVGICISCSGCVSGYFKLDPQSRLPGWFHNVKNIPRENLDIKIVMYETTTSTKGKIEVIIASGGETIESAKGLWWWHQKSLEKTITAAPPNWTVVEINGTREIYEQRERNDILRIVDEVDIK